VSKQEDQNIVSPTVAIGAWFYFPIIVLSETDKYDNVLSFYKNMSEGKEYSHTARVKKNAVSIKTTIPHSIVKSLELGFNDLLQWQLEMKKGKKVATVSKVE
jgi:hypothetical protein